MIDRTDIAGASRTRTAGPGSRHRPLMGRPLRPARRPPTAHPGHVPGPLAHGLPHRSARVQGRIRLLSDAAARPGPFLRAAAGVVLNSPHRGDAWGISAPMTLRPGSAIRYPANTASPPPSESARWIRRARHKAGPSGPCRPRRRRASALRGHPGGLSASPWRSRPGALVTLTLAVGTPAGSSLTVRVAVRTAPPTSRFRTSDHRSEACARLREPGRRPAGHGARPYRPPLRSCVDARISSVASRKAGAAREK